MNPLYKENRYAPRSSSGGSFEKQTRIDESIGHEKDVMLGRCRVWQMDFVE